MTPLVMVALLVTAAAASSDSGAALAGRALPVVPTVGYRGGMIAPGRDSRFVRSRVPVTFALLSLSSRKRLKKEPFETDPLAPGEIEVMRMSETRLLTVERIRFWSERMQQPRFFLVLVPKAPLHPDDALILNHGWFDRPEYLLTYLHLDETYNASLERGELRPAILILPDTRFESMRRLRNDLAPPYLKLIAEEIPTIVSRRYRIPLERDHWAIGGFSFGGYLSLDIARRYPKRFDSLSMVSGFFNPKWTFWPGGPPPRLFLACGTNDWLFSTMRSLHDGLAGIGITGEWRNSPGGHTWKYWSSVIQPMLMFHLGR